jgi:hypothetical protein
MSKLEALRVTDLKDELSQIGLSDKSNLLKKDLVQLLKDVIFLNINIYNICCLNFIFFSI